MDNHYREDLPFPQTPPEFQRLFPDNDACALYLLKLRWCSGFTCPYCASVGDPLRFSSRPSVLRCRKCRRNTGLTVGTVMERSHLPLNVWFWAAYLVTNQSSGISAKRFCKQVGIPSYETAFRLLHKLRAGIRPDQERIGGKVGEHVELHQSYVGGRTQGNGRGVHELLVALAIEVLPRKSEGKLGNPKSWRRAGRIRLAVVPERSAISLCAFVEGAVKSGTKIVTDDWSSYAELAKRGYDQLAVVEREEPQIAEQYLPISHLVFADLKSWLISTHHGVSPRYLQAYLDEFTFRFNRRFDPINAFQSLLGIAGDVTPTLC